MPVHKLQKADGLAVNTCTWVHNVLYVCTYIFGSK